MKYFALLKPIIVGALFSLTHTTIACTKAELDLHNSMSETEKEKFYGFDGSGIPCSEEMVRLKKEWKLMNSSSAKQLGRERFNKNKFGMFIHWGLYSSLGGVWKGETMEENGIGPRVAEWVMRNKEIPRDTYAKLAKDFNPIKFNAEEWIAVAKAAGMRYIVITSKHHEGFALYNSEVSNFNVVDATPFGRDIIKEMEVAATKAGISFGIYYSNTLDWRDGGDGGILDYGPKDGKKPRKQLFYNNWDPSPIKFDEYIANKSIPQVKELLSNYKISQIWFDNAMYIPPKYSMQFYRVAYQYSPETLINWRVGNGFGDIGMPGGVGDNVIPDQAFEETWEGIATTNNSWGYKTYDKDWKSPKELLFWLVENVSKGGNFLLNVGPDGQGSIPPEAISSLETVGDWLNTNGNAIYDTGPWEVTHEGPTKISIRGTEHREENVPTFEFEENDYWFTKKQNKVYLISLQRPSSNQIMVEALSGHEIKQMSLLGESINLKWANKGNKTIIELPEFSRGGIGYAIEVVL